MKQLTIVAVLAVALLGGACKKKKTDEGAGSGSAPAMGSGSAEGSAPSNPGMGVEVTCQAAAAKYTDLMANGTGNELADMKPDGGAVAFVRVTLEEDCDNGWSKETRECISATTTSPDLAKCWKDPSDPMRGEAVLHNVVEEMKAKMKANAGSGSAEAGSGSGS